MQKLSLKLGSTMKVDRPVALVSAKVSSGAGQHWVRDDEVLS
jgi:hypothetical protein